MAGLRDPIEIKAAISRYAIDDAGACKITLTVDATQAVKGAQLALMRGIVFRVKFTPDDVATRVEEGF